MNEVQEENVELCTKYCDLNLEQVGEEGAGTKSEDLRTQLQSGISKMRISASRLHSGHLASKRWGQVLDGQMDWLRRGVIWWQLKSILERWFYIGHKLNVFLGGD